MNDGLDEIYKPPAKEPRSNRTKIGLIILVAVVAIALYVLLPVLTIAFVGQPVRVAGKAMSPTLNDGDRLLISKQVGELNRGDIVVFLSPDDTSKSFMMRIIGLPGDRLDVDPEGNLTVNSQMLKEDYIDPARNRAARSRWNSVRTEWKEVKPGSYFLMGDNRDASNDSRIWGPVSSDLIYGKYVFRYWASMDKN